MKSENTDNKTLKSLFYHFPFQSNYEDLENYIRLIIHPAPRNFSLLMDLTGEEKPRLVYPDSETEGVGKLANFLTSIAKCNIVLLQ